MGVSAWYDVWCDAEGCAEWTYGGATRSAAARAARMDGWKRLRRGGWRCPACQKGARRD